MAQPGGENDLPAQLARLEDGPFLSAWRELTDEQRSSYPAGFARKNKLEPWVNASINKLRAQQPRASNGNGADELEHELHDEEPPGIRHYGGSTEPTASPSILNWTELAKLEPPKFEWLLDHWLSWSPTLLSGKGGVGKSLLAQQVGTGLATGRPLWGTSSAPVNVLYWACEDDKNEIWRRQDRICRSLSIGFEQLTNLHIDARCGLNNAIFATDFGRPAWTALYAQLQQQVNDLNIDVLILDNIGQTYGGNENDRHHVTTFLNGIIGLVGHRRFCPIILGHLAKSPTSEYSGSTAWENAVRMRWYLAEKLPEEAGDDRTTEGAEVNTDTRFLCKRKSNYSAQDYVQFSIDGGLLKTSEQPSNGDGMAYLRGRRARTVVLQAVQKLASMGVYCGEAKGTNYLPSKILEMKLGDGASKAELRTAMNGLMVDGELTKGQVGTYAKGAPRFGLIITSQS